MMLTTSTKLLQKCLDPRNEGGWQDFIATYKPWVVQIVWKNLDKFQLRPSSLHVEEFVDDIFSHVWEQFRCAKYDLDKKTNPGGFRSWLRQVVRTKGIDHARTCAKRRDSSAGGDGWLDILSQQSAKEQITSEFSVIWNDVVGGNAMHGYVEELSEKNKAIFQAVYFSEEERKKGDLSLIAEEFSMKPQSLYNLLKKFRSELHTFFSKTQQELDEQMWVAPQIDTLGDNDESTT